MKKLILLFIITFVSVTVIAQETSGFSVKPGRSTTFVKNNFFDNWFVGAGAGANIYFGDKDVDANFRDRITVTPNFQFGKWFNPYSGARIKFSGGTNIHTFNNNASLMTRNRYVSAEINLLWNVTDYLMRYNVNRVYSFIPYVGGGWVYGWDYQNLPLYASKTHHINSITLDAGIINRFRFSPMVGLDIEFSGKLLRDKFDQRIGSKHNYDVLGTASASLVFNISKKAIFTEALLRDQNEIDDLNNTVNRQRGEIASLSERKLPIVEPKVIVKEVVREVKINEEPVNNVVLFNINKIKLESHQEVNVYNVAKYLKENSGKKVRVIGYTDSATGTAVINERLSRQRAQNVADVITGKYGIAEDRVIVEWVGQTKPPFDVTEWNRAVILYIE